MDKVTVFFMVTFFMALVSAAWSAPTLVCDPQAGVQHYVLTGPGWVPAQVSAQPDGSIRMDVSTAAVGVNSLTVKACKQDAVWGEQCSGAAPFSFTRPHPPAAMTGAALIP